MPFMTRAGHAEAPMDPGARTLCEPWDLGPEAKLWRLIVPWKPLPLEVPETLTVWPDLEGLDGHGLADHQLAGLVAELDERAHRRRAALRGGPSSGLVSASRARRRRRAARPRSRRRRACGSR
jgi:hypothetical protein